MKLVFFLCLMGEKVFVAEIFLGVSRTMLNQEGKLCFRNFKQE